MNNLRVSVIMPAYNAANTIEESINSVLNQSYHDVELIVCDDNSNDDTVGIVEKYTHLPNVVLCRNEHESKCASGARNTAISIANGRYIAFLDSDDIWHPEKIHRQVLFFKNNAGVIISHGNYTVINKDGEMLSQFNAPSKIGYRDLLYTCGIGCLTVMIDTERYGKKPLFREIFKEDYDLWLDILKSTRTYSYNFCDEGRMMSSYRKYNGSISSNKILEVKRQYAILKRYEPKLASRILCILSYVANGLIKYKRGY